MPTHAIDRTGTLAPEASLQLAAEYLETQRLDKMDRRIADLLRSYATAEPLDLDLTLAPTLEDLGLSLEADRVQLFFANGESGQIPTSDGNTFELRGAWRPTGDRLEETDSVTSIDLDCLPDQGRGLRAGRVQRSTGMPTPLRESLRSTSPSAPGWSPARATLYLPCLSPCGLLGFFAVEGGLTTSRWGATMLDRGALIGSQFAMVLDRYRQACELDAMRVRDGRNERLETLGRVAGGVAHDFNNVLTAILGYADLLEIELADNGQGQIELGEIRDAAMRAAEVVEQVLSFGRTRSDGVRSVDLGDCLTGLRSMILRVLGEGIALELDLESVCSEEEASQVRIDPGRLERVLLNLASNARAALVDITEDRRFSLSVRRVTIDLDRRDTSSHALGPVAAVNAGDHIRLTASDNGCGMDSSLTAKIFEPFFTTKETSGGTGFGLATTAEILRESNGGIRVESVVGEGSAFHLYFPIAASATHKGEPATRLIAAAAAR